MDAHKKPDRYDLMVKHAKFYGITNQFVIIFLPLLVLISLIFGAFLMQERESKRKTLLFEEQQNVELMQRIANDDLRSIVVDLSYLASLPILRQIVETDKPTDHLKISNIFLDFCKSSTLYDQIRFLDENGMEIIRVNYDQGRPGIVPKEQLQNKTKRYYFTDVIRLESGQFFVSPLDLNVEQGLIEQPLKPTIRFGTPIVDLNGQKQGIVLLNYLGANIIRHLDEASVGTIGKFMLLNSHGYWLKGLDSKDEWGFMFDDRKEKTFAESDLQAWEKIAQQKSGQFRNKQGIYSFSTIHPIVRGMISSTGSGGPFDSSEKTYSNDEYYWKVVSFIPVDILREQFALIHFFWVISYVLTGIFLGLFSWFLASNMVRRKQAEVKREKLIEKLQKALEEVKILSGLLPICMHCKKIRDDSGYWKQIETYIHEHTEAQFSHGICEDCAKEHYPDYDLYDD
jgi:hypothetical protein